MRLALAWSAAACAAVTAVAVGMLIAHGLGLPFSGQSAEPATVGGGAGAWETSEIGIPLFAQATYALALLVGAHAYAAVSRSPEATTDVDSFVHITAGVAVAWCAALVVDLVTVHTDNGWIHAMAFAGFFVSLVLSYEVGKRVRLAVRNRRTEAG